MAASLWDPAQYTRFEDERLRPVHDLLARIPLAAPRLVYDLGCGTGRASALLAERWPEAAVTGIDTSAAMLARARAANVAVAWVEADIASWRAPRPADLIFSNAALHWLDGHGSLFPSLLAQLAPGGVLAVQMPRNYDAPSHRAMAEAADAGPWRDKLERIRGRLPVADPAHYYDLLVPLARSLDIWETVYIHALQGEDPVLEWVKGTGLKPFLEALGEAERRAYLADYAERLRRAYPRRADGRTLFPFRRLFIVAQREHPIALP